MFGHTSEKHLPLAPNQFSLFNGDEITEDGKRQLDADVAKTEETITYSATRKAKPLRKPLDDSRLPLEEGIPLPGRLFKRKVLELIINI